MRRAAAIVACSLALAPASRALANRPRVPHAQHAPSPDRGDFWRELVDPHGEEVRVILGKARNARQTADVALYGDYDPSGRERARMYRGAYGALRYAHRLAPENVDVLRELGIVADELGRAHEARDAFETIVRLVGPDKAGADVTGRLGALYLRLGRVDDAVRFLRLAQAPVTSGNIQSAINLIHLADALASRGAIGDAIDALANGVPANAPYFANELALATFALAVTYDRDEQRGAAFDVLDRMQSQLSSGLAATVENGLSVMRFARAEDKHYYLGLLYEVTGNYMEARTEWLLYAAGDAPFRARALEHVATLDAQRRAPAAAPATKRGKP